MNHWKARRLLPQILDGTLQPQVEAWVRGHLHDCRRCRNDLEELDATEALLAQLPLALVPFEYTATSDVRLERLARWAAEPPPTWSERLGVPALGAFAAAAMLAMLLSTAGVLPPMDPPSRSVTLAAVMPEARLLPTGVR
jgi:anti-sigma factor RsiW